MRSTEAMGDVGEKMRNMEKVFRAVLANTGMPPAQVAEAVVDAIRNDRFYIITHEETRARVQTRLEDILEGRSPTMPS
jgi:hypothetical protein